MGFNLQEMTVDYKKLLKIVPTQRAQLARSGAINDIIGALTPGQLVSLFPRYYREQLPDVGQINKYAAKLDVALSSGSASTLPQKRTGNVTTYGAVPSPGLKKTMTPEEKAIQDLFTEAGLNQVGSGVTAGITDRQGRVISTASTNLSPQERALLDTIAMGDATSGGNYWESPDYTTIVGGKSFQSFEDHPRVFGTPSSTAAGRYQFTKTTWDDVVTRYNKRNPDDPINDFSPGNQDRAALFLARERYKANTGRDLDSDLASPPENFGELIKTGLGTAGPGSFLTWEIFLKKNQGEIQKAFESNYERNIGYVKDMEAAAENIKDINNVIANFEPSMISQLDERLQKWYENASEIQKQKFETAIEKLGIDRFNEKMKDIPVNSSTLTAASSQADIGAIPNAAVDPSAVGDKRRIPLTEAESGIKVLDRMNWVSEQTSLATGEKISYEVFSALQPPGRNDAERGGEGKGGYRHGTNVGAADIRLIAEDADGNKRYITANSEGRDKEILNSALKYIGKSGFTGVGIGKNYQGGHLHVGFGEDSLWNSGADGDIMKDEYAQYIRMGQQDAADQGFDFEEMKKERERLELEAQSQMNAQTNSTPPTSNVTPPTSNVTPPALATGGLVDVPPGENLEIKNRDTGEVLAYANDRENIRVEPGELEGSQEKPRPTQEDITVREVPTRQDPASQRVMYKDNPDPDFGAIVTADTHYTPSSYERATLSATLRPERNIHFAPSKHT